MSKIKIPIWDNAYDFPEELEDVGLMLLSLSDRDHQVRVWAKAEGPEVQWFGEAFFNVELQTQYFKNDIRNCEIKLSKEQIKAILRIEIMFKHFDRLPESRTFPDDFHERQMAIIDHPYFEKIRKRAAYAASLIRLPVPRNKAK